MDLVDFAPIIARIKNVPATSVVLTPQIDIVDDLAFDSLAITELLYSLEEHFNVVIDYERMRPEHLRKLGSLHSFLLSNGRRVK